MSIEDGQKAARACAINLLAQIKVALGDLDKVQRVVRLGGFINATPDFLETPKVMNGASDLMVTAFGDRGRHARTTIGVAVLPLDAAVEVEGMFEVVVNRSCADMPGLDWLTARPVAHRGLHDAAAGVIENTASAFRAAIEGGFAIETDLQLSADGEAMVHHDFALGRLTLGTRQLAAMTAAGLKEVPFKDTADRMMTLGELCELVAGRAPLLIELKSRFDGDLRLVAARRARCCRAMPGPVAADVVRSGRRRGAARDRARPAARHRGRAALRAIRNGTS